MSAYSAADPKIRECFIFHSCGKRKRRLFASLYPDGQQNLFRHPIIHTQQNASHHEILAVRLTVFERDRREIHDRHGNQPIVGRMEVRPYIDGYPGHITFEQLRLQEDILQADTE